MSLFELRGLETRFKTREGVVHAVNGASLYINRGETLGVVGESGCGKSVTMMSFLGLIPSPPGQVVAGEAIYNERDLLKLDKEQLRQIRGKKISIIFQDPMTSFNPVMPIGKQVAEPLEIHDRVGKAEARDKAAEMLSLVGIPDAGERFSHYPHQFSGGMRQRAMIAMALICNPELLIADEPTTALDVTVQAQIVELIQELQEKFGMAVIWITHDLGVVAGIADRVAVMYGGRIIEEAPVEDLYENPQHPYTRGLFASLPRVDERGRLIPIKGMPPIQFDKPKGCTFAPRCEQAKDRCFREVPTWKDPKGKHRVACF